LATGPRSGDRFRYTFFGWRDVLYLEEAELILARRRKRIDVEKPHDLAADPHRLALDHPISIDPQHRGKALGVGLIDRMLALDRRDLQEQHLLQLGFRSQPHAGVTPLLPLRTITQ
jgi:hypothetical protein